MSSMEEDYKTALGFLLEFGSDGYLPCPDPDGSGDIAYQAAVRIKARKEKKMNVTTTYSMQKAKEAFENGLPVWVAHPDEPDAPINSLEELEGAEHHLFVIEQTHKAEVKLSIELTPTEANAIMVMLDNEMENHFSEGIDLEIWENLDLDAYRMLAFQKFKTWYKENV